MIYHAHSYFSLRYGLLSPEDIIRWANSQADISNSAINILLADINNVSGATNFLKEAAKYPNVIPHLGVEIKNNDETLYLLIATSHLGFANMNQFLSQYLLQQIPFPVIPPLLNDVRAIYPFHKVVGLSPKDIPNHALIGVTKPDLRKLRLSPWKNASKRLLAYHKATFRNHDDFHTHTLLRCVNHNCLITKLKPNSTGLPTDLFCNISDLIDAFSDTPILLHNAQKQLENTSWTFDFNVPQNKKTFTENADKDYRMLKELAFEGLKYRYPNYTYETTKRLEKEMQLIYELGFTAYFLINWDICRFAEEQGFFHVGRGSGANSMVAYCLKITDVDPIDLDLYFERFINPYRSSPPDFDIDFSWQDRDKVTAYIMQKYGPHNVALVGTYNTFQSNAVVRELGKVYGLPKAEIDSLLERPTYYGEANFEEFSTNSDSIYSTPGIGLRNRDWKPKTAANSEMSLENKESLYAELLKHAQKIHNLPNYRSIHVGGILISEKSMYHYTALEMPPKGFPTVQFSMLEAEDLGLAKFDILSQRGLGHIKDAVTYVKENQGIVVDPHQIQAFKNDPKIARIIETGFTMGCFYVESPAMRQLLKKLKCRDYLTLVAASSVIRPGVARSGMMRTFIERHIDEKKRQEAHPVLQEIMPETYGIMVYQEDVIRVAHHFAGLGLAESDVLRRGMSGKFRSKEEFLKVQQQFYQKAKEKGHSHQLIVEVWKQIESFAGYSFAKGHSASYAVESYQSLHLKAYYPLEFYVAVINNFGGFYRTEFYVHAARMCGADVQAPCVNHSRFLTRIEGKIIWLGLGLIQSLEQKCAERIYLAQRERGFDSLYDFKERVEPGLEQLKILIQIGAFRFTQRSRKELLWEAHSYYSQKKETNISAKLFTEAPKSYTLPPLEDSWLEIAIDQREFLGFTLCSPFELLSEPLPEGSQVRAKELYKLRNKSVMIEGYLVTVKPTKTIGGKEMNFGTWIDRDGYFFDSIHFPQMVGRYPFKGRGVYRIWGQVTVDFGVFNIEVTQMEKLGIKSDPRI